MRYETIVEVTPEGQHMLRLAIIPDDRMPYDRPDDDSRYVIVPPIGEEESGVITWKM
jgi:hypothetical protein